MSDLRKLQDMAKSGKFSERLLGDEEFKKEFKNMLSNESGIEIDDDQIPEMVKKIEGVLQDKKFLEEVELEDVSGGHSGADSNSSQKGSYTTGDKVKFISAAVGAALGTFGGVKMGASLYDDPSKQLKKENKRYYRARARNALFDLIDEGFGTKINKNHIKHHILETLEAGPIHTVGTAGAAAGAGLGYGVGSLICKALGI